MSSFVFRNERDTVRKFLYEARLQEETSNNSNAWQSEWGFTGFTVRVVQLLYERNALHFETSLKKEVSHLLKIKKKQRSFRRFTGA